MKKRILTLLLALGLAASLLQLPALADSGKKTKTVDIAAELQTWTGIKQVVAGWERGGHGAPCLVGLKKDGTAVAIGLDVSDWKNISAVSVGGGHALGLRANGTVATAGENELGECDVSEWKNLSCVCAGREGFSIGAQRSGAVVFAGYAEYSPNQWTEQFPSEETSAPADTKWERVKQIVYAGDTLLGLRTDGSVLAFGFSSLVAPVRDGSGLPANARVKALFGGEHHAAALLTNGTAQAWGEDKHGQCQIEGWKGLTALALGGDHTLGLLSSGMVVSAGDNDDGQCNVGNWTNITAICAGDGWSIGVRADGTLALAGEFPD